MGEENTVCLSACSGYDWEQLRSTVARQFDLLEAEKLPAEYERVADMLGCSFFHASSVAEPGEDSLHMTKDSHQRFAEAMAVEIRRILD